MVVFFGIAFLINLFLVIISCKTFSKNSICLLSLILSFIVLVISFFVFKMKYVILIIFGVIFIVDLIFWFIIFSDRRSNINAANKWNSIVGSGTRLIAGFFDNDGSNSLVSNIKNRIDGKLSTSAEDSDLAIVGKIGNIIMLIGIYLIVLIKIIQSI